MNELSQSEQGRLSCIGLYDTGLGGFSIYSHLRFEFPEEPIVAIADSELFRYGKREFSVIRERTIVAINWLISQGARAVVIACNTAFLSVEDLVSSFSVPVVGPVYPAASEALRKTKVNRIGVAATDLTAQSLRYSAALAKGDNRARVYEVGCSPWVFFIERGELDSDHLFSDICLRMKDLVFAEIDTLILGCTHFPIIREQIGRAFSYPIEIVDSAAGIAKWLITNGLISSGIAHSSAARQANGPQKGARLSGYHVTDEPEKFQFAVRRIFGSEIEVEKLVLSGLARGERVA